MKHLLNQNLQPHTRLNLMATPLHRALRSVRQHCGKAAMAVAMVAVAASFPAKAQALSEASAALSLLPVASVVGTASVASAAAGALVAVPAAVLVGGAALTVAALQASAVGTVYVLERTSDGAQASVQVQVLGRGVGASAHGVGTVVVCSAIGTGVLLSAAGEVLAFVPNALGQALLHNERL